MVDMHLEVDTIPVSDVERSKHFYARLGWRLDEDVAPAKDVRIVQFTPPGSGCSVTFGTGLTPAAPGSAFGTLVARIDGDVIAEGVRLRQRHAALGGTGSQIEGLQGGAPIGPPRGAAQGAQIVGAGPERPGDLVGEHAGDRSRAGCARRDEQRGRPVRGSARTTPPSPSRPTNRVPSRVEVMLSGNARSPGSAIDDGPASTAVIQRTDENSAPANAACV